MTRREIVNLVEDQGGYVSLKQAGEDLPLAVFSSLIGCDARCGTQGWEYSLLLIPDASGWTVRFGEASATRPLATGELRQALESWLSAPGVEPFAPFLRET